MRAVGANFKEIRLRCPRCKVGKLENPAGNFFLCSKCKEIYRKSPMLGLERLTVDPVSDLSSYPNVVVDPESPYCHCRLLEYLETAGTQLGPSYCSKHNIISIGGMYGSECIDSIDKVAEYIILHETIHWVLSKILGEPASDWLDNEGVSKFLEDCFLYTEELKRIRQVV